MMSQQTKQDVILHRSILPTGVLVFCVMSYHIGMENFNLLQKTQFFHNLKYKQATN